MDSVRTDFGPRWAEDNGPIDPDRVLAVESYERQSVLAVLLSPVDDLVELAASLNWSPTGEGHGAGFAGLVYRDLGAWLGWSA